MSHTIIFFFISFFHGYSLFIVFMFILCNFHSCTPHNSVTVWDIFMKFYRNVNEYRQYVAHNNACSLFLVSKLCSFDLLFLVMMVVYMV